MAEGAAGATSGTVSSGDSAAAPSAWDCFWHPIDCATRSVSSGVASAETGVAGVIGSTTAPLHEVTQTSMWTAIGIAAAAVAVIAICIVAVYAFHRI